MLVIQSQLAHRRAVNLDFINAPFLIKWVTNNMDATSFDGVFDTGKECFASVHQSDVRVLVTCLVL